jgi:hypothetical protein
MGFKSALMAVACPARPLPLLGRLCTGVYPATLRTDQRKRFSFPIAFADTMRTRLRLTHNAPNKPGHKYL